MLKEAISGLLNPSRQSSLPQYPRLRKRCSSDCGWPCLTCDGGMGWCGLSLYGSFARGAAVEDSDVDLLVELPRPLGLEFVALVQRKLGRKVDLATFETFRQSLTSPHYRDIALNIQESWPMSGKRGDRESGGGCATHCRLYRRAYLRGVRGRPEDPGRGAPQSTSDGRGSFLL